MTPFWNPAGYLRNVVETVRVTAAEENDHATSILLALAAAATLGLAAAYAAPGQLQASGGNRRVQARCRNLEVVQNNCTACHSADYIKTQPRGEKFKKDFWAGRSHQDDQGLWRADRRHGRRQDRRLSRRELLRREAPGARGRWGKSTRSTGPSCGDAHPLPVPAGQQASPWPHSRYKTGKCRDFAASNDRQTGKKAKMRCDMALFCRNGHAVCATQSATTRVS